MRVLRLQGTEGATSIITSTSIGAIVDLAQSGQGVATLPRELARRYQLTEIDMGIDLPNLSYAGSYLRTRLNPIYDELCELAVDVIQARDASRSSHGEFGAQSDEGGGEAAANDAHQARTADHMVTDGRGKEAVADEDDEGHRHEHQAEAGHGQQR